MTEVTFWKKNVPAYQEAESIFAAGATGDRSMPLALRDGLEAAGDGRACGNGQAGIASRPVEREKGGNADAVETAGLKGLEAGPFALLDREDRARLAAGAICRKFCRGEVLYREGQQAARVGVLLEGLVRLSCHASRGRECVLYLIRPGHWLDVGMLFYAEGAPSSAVALSAGQVLWLENDVLRAVLEHSPALTLELLRLQSIRQRLLMHKLASIQGRPAASRRVALWLLHRARMEQTDTLTLTVSREILAQLIGMSRERLSRELHALAARGCICLKGRQVRLLDREALRRLAQ